MDDLRRSSVYDLTSLRLHPDGLRVHQTHQNLKYGRHKHKLQHSRRQWIANDAGGSYGIPVYRHEKKSSSTAGSMVDEEEEEGEVMLDEEDTGQSPSGKGKRKMKHQNVRPIKKKKFIQDDSYLSIPSLPGDNSGTGLSDAPSQDLLKNIHCLAARYYDEQGLLLDASRRYRQEKKLRNLRKLGLLSETTPEDIRSSEGLPEDGNISDKEQPAVVDSEQRKVTRDMYRVLDGSVLLAIGVLTQELVKKLVDPKRVAMEMKSLPLSDDDVSEMDDQSDPIEDYEDDEDPGEEEEGAESGEGEESEGEDEEDEDEDGGEEDEEP